jgi:alkylation response protein AidB-like acyl-CoA dehydrogenase
MEIRDWWSLRTLLSPSGRSTATPEVARDLFVAMARDGLFDLPLPGCGATDERFEALRTLGELDLTIGRLAEAHADALAILAELSSGDVDVPESATWAVWAAEPPTPKLQAQQASSGRWLLTGRKPWCSGAGAVSAALVTAHTPDGPRLFAVDMAQRGVVPADDAWAAPALSGTDTRSVDFFEADATPVGEVGQYVQRVGFWYGAIGVAAVWHGGAVAVGRRLADAARERELGDLGAAHLGSVVSLLSSARAVLRDAARAIDEGKAAVTPDGEILARCARAAVEDSATRVIDHVGRALGPGPLSFDGLHARRVTDLQLYLRQSHADRDLAALGQRVIETGPGGTW